MNDLRVFATEEDLALGAAASFLRAAADAVAIRGAFTVALSGGRTPERLFRLLADDQHRPLVPWDRTHVFWADERLVPAADRESNFRLAHDLLLSHVPIPQNQIHRVETEKGAVAAEAYEETLREAFNALGSPRLDLVLLGLGADGHTASLMPDAEPAPGQWVIEPWVPHLRAFRVSLTEDLINQAREAIFVVAGADKAATVAAVLEGPSDPRRFPAQRIQLPEGRLAWYLDEAAARCLRRRSVA